jgi:hypothetical protein
MKSRPNIKDERRQTAKARMARKTLTEVFLKKYIGWIKVGFF